MTLDLTKPKPQSAVGPRYTYEQVELGMIAMAIYNGNSVKASEALQADPAGFKCARDTLRRWITQDPERYRAIQQREMPQIRVQAADRFAQLSELQAETAHEATERLREEIPNLPVDRLPQAVQSATYASGISTDKAREYRGEATVVVEHRDATEIMRKLKSKGVVIEGELVAEEDVL